MQDASLLKVSSSQAMNNGDLIMLRNMQSIDKNF